MRLIIMLGWLYVVGMIALTTGFDPQGGWLRAIAVWLFAGMLPMGLLYYMGGRGRRRQIEALHSLETTRGDASAADSAGGDDLSCTCTQGHGDACDATAANSHALHRPH